VGKKLLIEQYWLTSVEDMNGEKKYPWMWSGAQGRTHYSGARGPWFDPAPKAQDGVSGAPVSLLSDN